MDRVKTEKTSFKMNSVNPDEQALMHILHMVACVCVCLCFSQSAVSDSL